MTDILFMKRALELAQKGRGKVSPNPMVGCVIVYNGKIIGEGYHQKYGKPHAEVNAINSVKNHFLLSQSTVYVTLEPCAHFGKTPPCADLLVEKKVKKVVIASKDPFNEVNGKGIDKLKSGGIEVEVGVLENEAKELNSRFFTFHQKKRPYVILKWAHTGDGFIAKENGDSKWISNSHSRQIVHKWRTEEDAIMVGKNTALMDNPWLTSRNWAGRNPIRILLDSKLEVPMDFNLYNQESDTLALNTIKEESKKNITWVKLREMTPETMLQVLYERKIQSVIVEGGSKVLNSFIEENCWDEARVFSSTETFGKGIEAPKLNSRIKSREIIQGDQLITYQNPYG